MTRTGGGGVVWSVEERSRGSEVRMKMKMGWFDRVESGQQGMRGVETNENKGQA
jgi:hypothetical protein